MSFRATLIITFCAGICLCVSSVTRSQESKDSMRVTIIAVSEFEDPLLNDTELTSAIRNNALALRKYFEGHFKIDVQLFDTHDKTTDRALRDWLRKDLPTESATGINLIFILTHGFPSPRSDKKNHESEIYLAASNTFKKDPEGNAISGAELIAAFKRMPKKRGIFLFIDSCGSGAIDSDAVQETLKATSDLGSRVLILTSSMEDQLSYRARFTEALRTVWATENPQCTELNDAGCHCGGWRVIEPYLTAQVKKVPGVSPDVKQKVRMVSRYFPDFCVELFDAKQRLLFLFNGAPGDIEVTLQSKSRDLDPITIHKGETIPVNLNSSRYTLIAKRVNDSGDELERNLRDIRLDSAPVDVEVLFGDDVDKVDADQSAVVYLQSREMYLQTAEQLQEITEDGRAKLVAMYQVKQQDVTKQMSTVSDQEKPVAAQLAAAQRNLGVAESNLAKTPKCGTCYTEYPERTAAEKARDVARDVVASTESASRALQQEAANLQIEEKRISQARERLERIHERELTLFLYQQKKNELIQSLSQRAKEVFPTVLVDHRGINILLPNTSPRPADIEKIVILAKDVADLQVEIEAPDRGKGQQRSSLKIATGIRDELLAAGLNTTYVAARSYLPFPEEKAQVRIILSPRESPSE
jgi:hypothetical protein